MQDHLPDAEEMPRSHISGYDRSVYRRLVLEAAMEEGHYVRFRQHTGEDRAITRIAKPIALPSEDGPGGSGGVLVIPLLGADSATFPLDEVHEVRIATDHLPIEQVRRGDLAVGDPVVHPQFGFGIVQGFRAGGYHRRVVVRFEESGAKTLSLPHVRLRVLDLDPAGAANDE
jgi:hypothetical protein